MKHHSQHAALTAGLLIAALIAVAFLWNSMPLTGGSAQAAANPGSGGAPDANPVFAKKVTGVWWVDVPDWTEPGNDAVILNIRSDGTLTWNSTWQFGVGAGGWFDSIVTGAWRQTGPLQITTHELGFIFDGDGLHWFTGRVVAVYDFSPNFQTFTATFAEDAFLPDQNPALDEPFFSWTGDFGTGYRLNAPN